MWKNIRYSIIMITNYYQIITSTIWSVEYTNTKNISTLPEYMVNFWLVTWVLAFQHVVQRFIDPLDSSHHMVSPVLCSSFPWSLLRSKKAGDSSWGYALNTKREKNVFKKTSYLQQNHYSCYEWHSLFAAVPSNLNILPPFIQPAVRLSVLSPK